MCFLPAGVFGTPLAPFTPPAPSEGGRGRRKAAQNLGPVGSRPAGVPLLRGSGVSETISQTVQGPVGSLKTPWPP